MVRVPTATSAGLGEIKTASGALPMQSISSPIEAFGGQEAKGFIQGGAQLQEGAAGLMRYAAEEQFKKDRLAVLEIQDSYNAWEADAMNGENGFLRKLGGAAKDVRASVEAEFDKKKASFFEGKEFSPNARAAAERFFVNQKAQISRLAGNHETREMNAYEIGMMEADKNASISRGALMVNDPKLFEESEYSIVKNVGRISEKLGETKAKRDETGAVITDQKGNPVYEDTPIYLSRRSKELSALYQGAYHNLIDAKDYGRAADFLEKKKDVLGGETYAKLKGNLERETFEVRMQKESEKVASSFRDEASAYAHIRKTYSGAEQDNIRSRTASLFAERNSIERKSTDDAYRQGERHIRNGGTPETLPAAVKAALMDKGQYDAIGSLYLARKAGAPEVTNYSWLGDFLAKPPTEQAKIPLAEVKKNTDFTTYSKIETARAKSAEPFIAQQMGGYISDRLKPLGLDGAKEKDNRVLKGFYDEYEVRVNELKKKNGVVGESEQRKIVDDLVGQITLQKAGVMSFFGTTSDVKKPAIVLSDASNEEAIAVAKQVGVKPEELRVIIRKLQGRGAAVTMDNIKQYVAGGK
jgi:hypothetical protein